MKTNVLTLKWDHDEGEACINFDGLDKLHGVEKADFLNDCIHMLIAKAEEMGVGCFDDYLPQAAV